MKAIAVFIFVASIVEQAALGLDGQSIKTGIESAGAGSLSAYQTALARADVAVAKSLINESFLKGEVGEAIRDQTVGRYLHRNGQWLDVSPRLGPQGLDHVSVKLDENSVPRRMMVDETKFGSGRLSITKSGNIQMGNNWVSDRLSGLAKRLGAIHAQGDLPNAKVPFGLSAKRIVQVPLSESESVRFWRPAEGAGLWRYDGPAGSLPKAVAQLKNLSDLFKAGANGRIDFARRIFQVRIDGDVLRVKILDAGPVDDVGGNLGKLPVKANLELPLERTVWASDTMKTKIADELCRQMPHLDSAEAGRLAEGIQSTARTAEDALAGRSFARFAAVQTAEAGTAGVLVVVPMEIAMQLFGGASVNWSRVVGVGGLAFGTSALGNLAGNATTFVLRSELGYPASVAVAEICGLGSASRFVNVAGGAVAGGATAILFAYGGYWLGYYDIQSANHIAIAGVAGAGAGVAASAVTVGLVSTYATAGTGVAISSLSGASASSASLAWLGGGSLASGGLGMTAGTVILYTGVGIVALGVTAAVIYGFHIEDEHQDNVRLTKTIEYLSAKQTFFIPDPQHYGVNR